MQHQPTEGGFYGPDLEVEQTTMTHILGRELGPRVSHDYSGDWEFSLVICLSRGGDWILEDN